MASRKSEIQRASNLRGRVKRGERLTKDDSDWLASYESNKRKPGRPIGSVSKEPVETVPQDDDAPNDLADAAPPPVAEALPDPEPLPTPPKVVMRETASGGKSTSGKWQDKYRHSEKGGTGREHTCQLVAGYWVGALANMAEALKSAGIDPIIDPADLVPAIVLTVDEVLPDHVEISPRVMAVGGSTALVVQRFIRRDEIAKAQTKAKEREAFSEWREAKANPPPPPPPPEPTPPPPVEHVGTEASDPVNGRPSRQIILEKTAIPFNPADPDTVF